MVTLLQLRAATTAEERLELIQELLKERIPESRTEQGPFVEKLKTLPPGLRAMAATHELDVSLAMDDLGYHFGNWHNLDLAHETLNGLKELDATELAEIFGAALELAQAYWDRLGSSDWMEWYPDSELDLDLGELNEAAWELLDTQDLGIMSYWTAYAERHPERLVEG